MKRLISSCIAICIGSVAFAAAAQTEQPPSIPRLAPICQFALGAGGSNLISREIDGAAIKTLDDFRSATSTREYGAKLVKGGDFAGWDFSKVPLDYVCFQESNLAGASFVGAKGRGTGFVKTDLTGADFRSAAIPWVLFRDAKLKDVDAQEASFSEGQFDGGWFEGSVSGWNIDGANMSGFQFDCGITLDDGCPVYQGGDPISAKETDFTRATLHSFGLFGIVADRAILDGTIVGPSQYSDLEKANIRGDIILRGGKEDIRLSPIEAVRLRSTNARRRARNANASFDCSKARSKSEKNICGEFESDLRALDREVAKLYNFAKREKPGVQARQIDWLRGRNKCDDAEYISDCLRASYRLRKGQLLVDIGETDWLEPGEEALFVDELLPVSFGFSKTPYFKKIIPALVGASMTEILVRRGQDGLYSIRGSAIGANAHLCSLSASHLYFDKKTGWYVPVSEGKAQPVFRIFDGRLEIFANGRPDYEKYPDAGNYMSCGMRASFGEVIRIDADEATTSRIRKSLEETM